MGRGALTGSCDRLPAAGNGRGQERGHESCAHPSFYRHGHYCHGHWPADLQWLRDDLWKKNAKGTPTFALIRSHKLLGHAFGNNKWKPKMVPLIRKHTAAA